MATTQVLSSSRRCPREIYALPALFMGFWPSRSSGWFPEVFFGLVDFQSRFDMVV